MRTVLLVALLSASALARADFAPPAISTVPELPAAGQPFVLRISGHWPDGCGPELLPVMRQGRQIDVRVRHRSQAICPAVILPYTLEVAAFGPGEVAEAGSYRVRYSLLTDAGPRLSAFELVPVTGGQRVLPEPGYWAAEDSGEFPTSGSGIGFDLERQGTQVFLVNSVYDEDGRTSWNVAAGPQVGNVVKGELLEPAGGQALFREYRAPATMTAVGRVQIEIESPTTAVMWFSRHRDEGVLPPLELMPISIARFNFGYGPVLHVFGGQWQIAIDGLPARSLPLVAHRFGASLMVGAISEDFRIRLECQLDVAHQQRLPRSCQLYDGAELLARFDEIGYERLQGTDASGQRLALMTRLVD